ELAWEETRKWEAGLELGFIQNRINISVSYYRNRSANQLVGSQLPATTGFTNITINQDAEVENSGWEFSVTTENVKTSNFTWNSSFNLSVNRNKVLHMGPNLSSANLRQVGQPLNSVFVYKFLGVDPTGKYMVADDKGEPTA